MIRLAAFHLYRAVMRVSVTFSLLLLMLSELWLSLVFLSGGGAEEPLGLLFGASFFGAAAITAWMLDEIIGGIENWEPPRIRRRTRRPPRRPLHRLQALLA